MQDLGSEGAVGDVLSVCTQGPMRTDAVSVCATAMGLGCTSVSKEKEA